ncbi:hypothetical protein ACHWQZ_G015765 [Mnemiopsis leidyi]
MAKIIRIGELQCALNKQPLSFWSSFDFSVSVITTVGWGYTHPKTVLGKLFCMVYASFGVPLYIVVIGSNGQYIAHLAERLDSCWRSQTCLSAKSLVYLELVSKYIIVGILVTGFIFAYTQTVFETSHGGSNHEDENLKSWSWFQSLYYALISLTTIGFGDFFMPSASDEHKFYNFIQAMALVVSIIFGFALFTYAFNAYAEASRRQMNILREKYEAIATKNAILAFAQIYANSELMLTRSQSFITKNTVHVRKVSNAIEELKKKNTIQKTVAQSVAQRKIGNFWARSSTQNASKTVNKESERDEKEYTPNEPVINYPPDEEQEWRDTESERNDLPEIIIDNPSSQLNPDQNRGKRRISATFVIEKQSSSTSLLSCSSITSSPLLRRTRNLSGKNPPVSPTTSTKSRQSFLINLPEGEEECNLLTVEVEQDSPGWQLDCEVVVPGRRERNESGPPIVMLRETDVLVER